MIWTQSNKAKKSINFSRKEGRGRKRRKRGRKESIKLLEVNMAASKGAMRIKGHEVRQVGREWMKRCFCGMLRHY
jgi:hypothetical protein